MLEPELPGVAVLVVSLGSGGAEKQAVLLANHLRSSRRVQVISLIGDDLRLGDVDAAIPVTFLGLRAGDKSPPRLAMALRRARKALDGERTPVLVSLTWPANVLGWSLAALDGRLVHVLTERQSALGSRSRLLMRRLMYPRTRALATNTSATVESIRRAGLAAGRDIAVVPNFVDLTVPSRIRRSGHRPFRWICVARLTEQKDHKTLLRACALLQRRGMDFELRLVGVGALAASLGSAVHDHGLADRVSFLGERDDVPDLLAESDGFVLTSRWEGVPNAVLEAAAAGLPVVATDVDGTGEALPSCLHYLLAAPGDSGGIADRMERVMLMEPGEREDVGQRMRSLVRERHAAENVMTLWENLIDEAARSGSHSYGGVR